MPYNVPPLVAHAPAQNLSSLPTRDMSRSTANARRKSRNSGADAVGESGRSAAGNDSGDILRVSAVLDKMQNSREREYVAARPKEAAE